MKKIHNTLIELKKSHFCLNIILKSEKSIPDLIPGQH